MDPTILFYIPKNHSAIPCRLLAHQHILPEIHKQYQTFTNIRTISASLMMCAIVNV
jgi:hypothetical protein